MTWPTVQEVIAKAREVAAGDPDHVYRLPPDPSGCQYVHGDQPGCLFGHALLALGAPIDVLKTIDRDGVAGSSNSDICRVIQTYAPGGWDELSVAWCSVAQGAQDRGRTWGEAIREADNCACSRNDYDNA